MTVEEKARLEHYKTLGTLHRDQLDDYFSLRLMEEGYVKGVVVPFLAEPKPEEVLVIEVTPEGEVEEEKKTIEETTNIDSGEATTEAVMEKLQVHSKEGGEIE